MAKNLIPSVKTQPKEGELTTMTGKFQFWNGAAEPYQVDAHLCKWKRVPDKKGGSSLTLTFYGTDGKRLGGITKNALNVKAIEPSR